MMTSQPEKLFSSTLEQLGYGSIDESAGKPIPSCDWLFEKEETKELLVWLCNNLRPSNVLLNEEIKRYQELQARGLTLEGEQLSDAIETMKAIDNRQGVDSLTQEVANLQLELTKTSNQLLYMVSDRSKIATQHAKLTHRSGDLATYNEKLQEVSATLHQKLMASVNEMKDALKVTDASVSELVSLHERPAPNRDAVFLSHIPFEPYLESEKALVKQIDKVLVSTEQRDPRDAIKQYNFLGVTEIPPALMKVEPENTRDAFASELSRLRLHFEKSVILELDAKMREAKLPAEEQALEEWDDAFEHLSEEDLTNQLIATQEGLATTGQTIQTHITQTVPQLARTLAQVSVLPVLETDLKEQIDLVQETINTQLHAITNLAHQKSRLDFLKGNLLYEESQHVQTHTLIEAAIRGAKNAVGKKINPPAAPQPPSSIVDTSVPSTLSRAHTMLEKFSPSPLSIVTKDTIASSAANASQAISLANGEREILAKERAAMHSQLWLNINSLNNVLFAPQSNLQAHLANPELIAANEQLEKLLKVLEGMLTDVLKFQKSKQEEMRYWGPERQQERDLFVYFFNNPDKLVHMCEELKKRIEAGKISS
jgi:HAUS augmin-like complex subunit 3